MEREQLFNQLTVMPFEQLLEVARRLEETPRETPFRKPGSAKGRLIIREENDTHLEDFKDYTL